ncbi:MAG: ubiA [Phycisphaerales bacterium]|nr:ubiA [Phycisphaerales bacterium]
MTTVPSQSTIGNRQSAISKLTVFARDIKISHTIFALPWAILATFLAAKETAHPITAIKLLLILICMVSARTLAMAANRLLDASLDAQNPRTARRAIPSGALSKTFVIGVAIVCVVAFLIACYGFYFFYNNSWPLLLGLPVLAFLAAYPLLKRFTRLCHYYLGAALALAPLCAWLAIAGQLAWAPLLIAAAVLCWTAGFDIIYACQDYASDCATGVFSVPAKLGIAKALWVARLTHLACAALLVTLGWVSPTLSIFYFVGVAFAIGLLIVEHLLVKPNDLSKVGLAFFTVNGVISLLVGTLGMIDVLRAH